MGNSAFGQSQLHFIQSFRLLYGFRALELVSSGTRAKVVPLYGLTERVPRTLSSLVRGLSHTQKTVYLQGVKHPRTCYLLL